MSRKTSQYDIPELDFDADWGSNSQDNLPQSGEQINNFINNSFRNLARSVYYDAKNLNLLFFINDAARDLYLEDPEEHQDLILYQNTFKPKIFYESEWDSMTDELQQTYLNRYGTIHVLEGQRPQEGGGTGATVIGDVLSLKAAVSGDVLSVVGTVEGETLILIS